MLHFCFWDLLVDSFRLLVSFQKSSSQRCFLWSTVAKCNFYFEVYITLRGKTIQLMDYYRIWTATIIKVFGGYCWLTNLSYISARPIFVQNFAHTAISIEIRSNSKIIHKGDNFLTKGYKLWHNNDLQLLLAKLQTKMILNFVLLCSTVVLAAASTEHEALPLLKIVTSWTSLKSTYVVWLLPIGIFKFFVLYF